LKVEVIVPGIFLEGNLSEEEASMLPPKEKLRLLSMVDILEPLSLGRR
jgi:hypothetical protein